MVGEPVRERLRNYQALFVCLDRRIDVATRLQHVADLLVRNRQVALPAGVARIGRRKALSNVQIGLVESDPISLDTELA